MLQQIAKCNFTGLIGLLREYFTETNRYNISVITVHKLLFNALKFKN